MFDLYHEFRKLIAELDKHQVDYALCGGIAMAVYGHPRATVDIDLMILTESLDGVRAIATALGYTIRGSEMTFSEGAIEIRRVSKVDSESGQVLSLDLLLVTPEVRRVWDSRVQVDWEDGSLSVVSVEGLIDLKNRRGSAQDAADISALMGGSDDATN
jgi:hypothetical protein